MTLINTADALYLGGQPVDAVYVGAHRVWSPGDPEPPVGLAWVGGWRHTLAEGGRRVVGDSDEGGQLGYAYTDPVTGDVYFEFETVVTSGTASCGVLNTDGTPGDPGGWAGAVGQWFGRFGAGLAGGSQWSWNIYADESPVLGGVPQWPPAGGVLRWSGALRRASRAVWFRQVTPTAASAWFGGGNPETDTDPTATFGGSGDVRIACSTTASANIRLIAPADHNGAPPPGFQPA